ncbi:MAG: hypothetical protein ACK5MT_18225 [Actinomycetales bacterium]
MTAEPTLRAWVDESGSDRAQDPGTYVLAAAIGCSEDEPVIREQISRLRMPGQVKLHWRDENTKRRSTIAQAIAGYKLEHLVVVRAGRVDDRPERRRRKCLERLLYELEAKAVTDIALESRGPADDRRDIQMLNALRGQRYLSTAIRLTHVVGRLEPMLWIPDAVCGAVTSARTGDPGHRAALQPRLTLINI